MISTMSRTIEYGVKNSPPPLPSCAGEVREEVLVDEPEGVAFELRGQWGEEAQQFDEGRTFELLVAAWQDVLQLGVGGLDSLDRLVDRPAEVVTLGQAHEVRQSRLRQGRTAPISPCSLR